MKDVIQQWKTILNGINYKSRVEKHISKVYPDIHEYLTNTYPKELKYSEKIYRFLNDITETPVCKICGHPVSFRNGRIGYSEYCSPNCAAKDPLSKDKAKQTLIEKYGDASYNNREKASKTCLDKYGVDNPFASEEIKERIKHGYQDKYGVDYPSQSAVIQETRKKNTLEKYGVEHHMHLSEVVKKSGQTKLSRYGESHYNNREKATKTCLSKYGVGNYSKSEECKKHTRNRLIEKYDELLDVIQTTGISTYIVKCPHPECTKCTEKYYEIPQNYWWDRKYSFSEPCTRLLPISPIVNTGGTLELFVQRILDEYNMDYITNDRNILNGKELDIYIPEKKLAIECNGVYWHSDKCRDKKYHLDKYITCLDKGIQLLTLWEDQIILTPDIVKSIILSKLGIYQKRIFARKCDVREIDSKTCCGFLDQNHIQGKTNATVKLGLYYNDSLVGVMTFSKRSKLSGGINHSNEWELTRFCTLINTQVVGGCDKLLKYFIKTYHPVSITSFSSNDISTGGLYKKLGFVSDGNITPAYWYISKKDYTRYHRTSFSKDKLKKMGVDTEGKTEEEIMDGLGSFFKIYDSGHTKHILKF